MAVKVSGTTVIDSSRNLTNIGTFNGLTYPSADGTTGQVLTTNGSGTLTFQNAASGGATVSDTPPATPADGDLWYDTKSGAMFVYYVGPSFSVWVSVADAAPSIPIEFVSQATATTTSISTMPTHKAGDLLLMFAYRNNNNTAPTLPAGWTNITNTGGNTNSMRIAFKIAANASEASGTWTNATELNLHVYRNTSGVGASDSRIGLGTTLTYGGLTLQKTDGSSQVALFGGHRSTDTSISTPPTGTVLRSNTARAAGFDTDGGVTSWSQQTVEVGGGSSGFVTGSVELLAKRGFSNILAVLDFPASPAVGDVYSEGGNSFVWDGTAWQAISKIPFGEDQSYLNLSSPTVRNSGVIYQNTTGSPILVVVGVQNQGLGESLLFVAPTSADLTNTFNSPFEVDRSILQDMSFNVTVGAALQAVVPDGFFYRFQGNIFYWRELR